MFRKMWYSWFSNGRGASERREEEPVAIAQQMQRDQVERPSIEQLAMHVLNRMEGRFANIRPQTVQLNVVHLAAEQFFQVHDQIRHAGLNGLTQYFNEIQLDNNVYNVGGRRDREVLEGREYIFAAPQYGLNALHGLVDNGREVEENDYIDDAELDLLELFDYRQENGNFFPMVEHIIHINIVPRNPRRRSPHTLTSTRPNYFTQPLISEALKEFRQKQVMCFLAERERKRRLALAGYLSNFNVRNNCSAGLQLLFQANGITNDRFQNFNSINGNNTSTTNNVEANTDPDEGMTEFVAEYLATHLTVETFHQNDPRYGRNN